MTGLIKIIEGCVSELARPNHGTLRCLWAEWDTEWLLVVEWVKWEFGGWSASLMISKGSVEKEAEEPKSICGRSFTGLWSKRYGRTFCWAVVSAASVAGWPDESRAKCGVGGFGGILLMKSLLLHSGKELDPLVTAISCIRPRTASFVGWWMVVKRPVRISFN